MITLGLASALGAALATLVGGLVAFRFGARLPRVAAFGAGSLIAVALLDLLPEALATAQIAATTVMLAASGGFLTFYVLERLAVFHAHPEEHAPAEHSHIGVLGAAGVSLQSLLDGAALGLAFASSAETGLLVTVAVMLHKLTDGTSPVSLSLRGGHPRREAGTWLALASAAPLVGFAASALVAPPAATLGLLFAAFAGTFLYLGASHLLPEAHHAEPGARVALATLGGFGFVLLVGQLFGRA